MREIKFRVWDGKRMFHPAIVGLPPFENFAFEWDRSYIHNCQEWDGEDGFVLEPQLMQFTGLKDKNGVDIFEGDIIRKDDPCYWVSQGGEEQPDEEDLETWRGGTGQVVDMPFGYMIKEIDCGNWTFNGPEGTEWNQYNIEVIGNIYQSPDLLKKH